MNNINAKEIKGTRNKKSDFWSRRSLCWRWEFPMGVGAHVMSPRHVTSVNTIRSKPTPWSLNRKNDRYEIFIASSQTRATICKVTGFPKLLARRASKTRVGRTEIWEPLFRQTRDILLDFWNDRHVETQSRWRNIYTRPCRTISVGVAAFWRCSLPNFTYVHLTLCITLLICKLLKTYKNFVYWNTIDAISVILVTKFLFYMDTRMYRNFKYYIMQEVSFFYRHVFYNNASIYKHET